MRVIATGLAVCALLLSACGPDTRQGTAIVDVTVIDAINGVRDDQAVVYDGDEIVYVGPADNAPKAGTTIDGRDKFLIPGLWDMHVHLTYDDRFTDIMPASFLRYGVTSVRDTGGLLHKLLPVVETMRNSQHPTPRVFFSGPLLDGEYVVYDGQSAPEIGIRNLAAKQAAANVAALEEAGASFIKIYEMVSPEVFAALVVAAREHGLPVAAHVPLGLRASDVGPLVDSMEHLRNVELDCAENSDALLAVREQSLRNTDALSGRELRALLHDLQRLPAIRDLDEVRCAHVLSQLTNTIQVPTLRLNTIPLHPTFDRDDWREALARMPADVQADWQQPPDWLPADRDNWNTTFAHYSMAMIARMKSAGVPLGAGTDTPIAQAIPGYSLLNELELLVKAGLTPLEAIETATVQPAAFFTLTDEMGSIDNGKRADLVLLNANPINDINNLRNISLVISQGMPVPR